MRIKSKLLVSSIIIVNLLFTGCAEKQKRALAEMESLLCPLSETAGGNKTATCAIVSIPSKPEMQREYEKIRGPKPKLSDYNHKYTPAYGRERDAIDKKYKSGNENLEEQYTKMTEAERNEKRKKDYNWDLNRWEKGPSEKTESLFKNIENEIAAFTNTKGIKIVDRDKMDAILAEHAFQNSSAWASEKNIAEVGKALNAQYLVYVKPVIGSGSTKDINFECINVSTFQKIILNYSYGGFNEKEIYNLINAAYTDLSKSYLTSAIDGFWLCKGVMTNEVFYTEKTEKYLSPFSSGYSLEEPEKIPKKFDSQLKGSKLYINSNSATITKHRETCECEFSYIPSDSHIFGRRRDLNDKGDDNYTVVVFEHWWENISPSTPLTNCYIGDITILSEDGELSISDKAYKKDNTFAIHLGSDGKGKKQHYFLVFTKLKG